MGSELGLIVWRGGRGGIRTRADFVAWWQGWDQNQDWLCGVVAAVGSKPGLCGVVTVVGLELGLIVWRRGSGGIRNRTCCVVWWQHWYQKQDWLCGVVAEWDQNQDCVVWRQWWDQNQDWLCGVVAAVGSKPGLCGVVTVVGLELGLIVWRRGSGGIRNRTCCVVWWQHWYQKQDWLCGVVAEWDQNQDCVVWRQWWDQSQDWLCGVVAAVGSKPGLCGVVTLVGLEPGLILWRGGKGGIKTRTVWCGDSGGITTRTDCVAWWH